MNHIHYLQTVPSSRYDAHDPEQEGDKNTKFADLIIDGRSLYHSLKEYNMVPSLGWGSEEHQKQMIDYFLMNEMHAHLFYRYPILVCPWCGEEECGFISVSIELEEGLVIWSDFKLEPDNRSLDIGPFYFKWEEYKNAIINTYGIAGVQ